MGFSDLKQVLNLVHTTFQKKSYELRHRFIVDLFLASVSSNPAFISCVLGSGFLQRVHH